MEGSSTKETNVMSSNNSGTHNMDNFNHGAPPPPYYPQQQPQVHYTNPGVVIRPGVTVTRQPGVVEMQPGYGVPVNATIVGNTIVSTVVVEVNQSQPGVGSQPSVVQCRSCSHQIVTRVEYMPTGRTHIAALLLCLFGCWPCAFLPYCMGTCQTARHYCTNCGAYIGSF